MYARACTHTHTYECTSVYAHHVRVMQVHAFDESENLFIGEFLSQLVANLAVVNGKLIGSLRSFETTLIEYLIYIINRATDRPADSDDVRLVRD